MALKEQTLRPKPIVVVDPLEGLDDAAMLSLRHRIDLKLNVDLSKINLAEELGLQYRDGMIMLASVRDDKGVPANQRAQVFNSVSAMLEKIIKQQKIVYSAERLKRFESAFLKVLKNLPPEQTQVFFDLYGEFLKNPDGDVTPETTE